MQSTEITPELQALKTKLRAVWMAGDFGQIAKASVTAGQDFSKRLNLQPGTKVLDVACGTGNFALPAARAGAIVTGVDIAPNLLEQARASARQEGLQAEFSEGDAEALAFDDGSFDVVATMFGAMFAPRPEVVARELKRVCRPGGHIAMANWTPDGFIGQMFKTVASHVPQPPKMPPPIWWGVDEKVRERFGEGLSRLETKPRMTLLSYPFSPADVVEHFRKYFGPVNKAFDSLDEYAQAALRSDLEMLWTSNNQATDGTTRADAEYLEVIAVKS